MPIQLIILLIDKILTKCHLWHFLGPILIYSIITILIGTKILTKELDDFYKHVGYNPTPMTEINLLNQMGGFSKPHPTIFDVSPETGKIFEQWRMLNVPGSLKNGGIIK